MSRFNAAEAAKQPLVEQQSTSINTTTTATVTAPVATMPGATMVSADLPFDSSETVLNLGSEMQSIQIEMHKVSQEKPRGSFRGVTLITTLTLA